jgi:hypothetical protein
MISNQNQINIYDCQSKLFELSNKALIAITIVNFRMNNELLQH